jgi:hypothetical protein
MRLRVPREHGPRRLIRSDFDITRHKLRPLDNPPKHTSGFRERAPLGRNNEPLITRPILGGHLAKRFWRS